MICPIRLIDRRQIFLDCLHLLTNHEPGNELHIVPEVTIPGGLVDYILVSARADHIKDFVGIELQTLDTVGSVWPERQRMLRDLDVPRADTTENDLQKTFGMNWKMTAKTILVQMHHKIETFEHVNKKLVLVVQDRLLAYMTKKFSFSHLSAPASLGDSMHFHPYQMVNDGLTYRLILQGRLSTDVAGIAHCLNMQAEASVELEEIIAALKSKMSAATLFTPL